MKIAIIGQGGHCKVIEDIIRSNKHFEIIGYFDDKYEDFNNQNGLYFGPVSLARKLLQYVDDIRYIVAIGNNKIRKEIVEKVKISNEFYASLIHKTAIISPSVVIDHGSVVMANAVVNAGTYIGNHSIVNTCSVIEHDNSLGDFVHISPNATLTGSITVKEGVHIGAGAVIIPNLEIGEWSIIGAGATVIHNIPSRCTAVGVPAKIKIRAVGE
jgi:acetyltransferase EpsM